MSLRFRLNNIDSYQAVPGSLDRTGSSDGAAEVVCRSVPVIRLYCSLEAGQRICAHVHGVYPYLYVPYDPGVIPPKVYIEQLQKAIDNALALALRVDDTGRQGAFVARITLVKGVPLYGFHVGWRLFLKIYLLSPTYVPRLADLFLSGAVMGVLFQPYEAHIPYLLQFMADYNLFGCGWVYCQTVAIRRNPDHTPVVSSEDFFSSTRLSPEEYQRISRCAYELDIHARHILNRKAVKQRDVHHDFIERAHPFGSKQVFVHSMAELWSEECIHQDVSAILPSSIYSSENDTRQREPPWSAKDALYKHVSELIKQDELTAKDEGAITFENFIKKDPLEASVQTAHESVSDMYPVEAVVSSNFGDESKTVFQNEFEGCLSSESVDDTKIPQLPQEQHLAFESHDHHHSNQNDSKAVENLIHSLVTVEDDCTPPCLRTNSSPAISKSDSINAQQHAVRQSCQDPRLSGCQEVHTSETPPTNRSEEAKNLSSMILTKADIPENDETDGKTAVSYDNLIRRRKANSPPCPSSDSTAKRIKPLKSHYIRGGNAIRPQVLTDYNKISKPFITSKKHTLAGRKPLPISVNFEVETSARSSTDGSSLDTTSVLPDVEPKSELRLPCDMSQQSQLTGTTSPLDEEQSATPGDREHSATLSSPVAVSSFESSLPSRCDDCTSRWIIAQKPPTARSLLESLDEFNLPHILYQEPFYSNEQDVPATASEYAGRKFWLKSDSVGYLQSFDRLGRVRDVKRKKLSRQLDTSKTVWRYATAPPTLKELERSETGERSEKTRTGRAFDWNRIDDKVLHHMSILSVECHVDTRDNLLPNPNDDTIKSIFWAFWSAGILSPVEIRSGMITWSEEKEDLRIPEPVPRRERKSELEVVNELIALVHAEDPDILTGYEIQNLSWGYIIERGRVKYGRNLCSELSRIKFGSQGRFGADSDRWGFNQTAAIHIPGRHMINLWRVIRSDLSLLQYSIENVAWHVLHRRIPHYAHNDLTRWNKSGKPNLIHRLFKYYISRVQLNLHILDRQDTVSRMCEQARLLGIDFYSVASRGSQYKVESLVLRIAKPESLMMISPSRKQVGQQNALQCLPLVMEPISNYYTSPVVVLDFQSLYPSIMIAYNYCYTTCLGKVDNWIQQNKFGVSELRHPSGLLSLLKNDIFVAPNGVLYVRPSIRRSLLARMLGEILETRIMIKNSVALNSEDPSLARLQNSRQLALKYIANVTYGYTSATFSGRMPCAEIADSIVQSGREILEKAIETIHQTEDWNAEVIYGDTDSIFVLLKGRSRDEAFLVGENIASTITLMNSRPIKLKMEKVYHPCVLLAKKRYAGYKYEKRQNSSPKFEAKGIETIRRDGIPAQQRIEENALRLLFDTADLSRVKSYFQQECRKLMENNALIKDFCFAKEVRMGTYSDRGLPPPGVIISARKMARDPIAVPQYGERVPYVIVAGEPGARLSAKAVTPEELLYSNKLWLDHEYYISRVIIPPLERIFNLLGVNVRSWYDAMTKLPRQIANAIASGSANTIDTYIRSQVCLICNYRTNGRTAGLCDACAQDYARTILVLSQALKETEERYARYQRGCAQCCDVTEGEEIACVAQDCPIFYSRIVATKTLQNVSANERAVLEKIEDDAYERLLGDTYNLTKDRCRWTGHGFEVSTYLPSNRVSKLLRVFCYAYLIGGITFIPIICLIVISWIYFISPLAPIGDDELELPAEKDSNASSELADVGVDVHKVGWLQITQNYESKRANGSRDTNFIGGFMNSYRQLMDRSSTTNNDCGRESTNQVKANHSARTQQYFAVLKHGNLFLYDSEDQIEVKDVIVLANHIVSLYPYNAPDEILWRKAHAICLTRCLPSYVEAVRSIKRASMLHTPPLNSYFIFADNSSEREDWYFALIRASKFGRIDAERPKEYDPNVIAIPANFEETSMASLIEAVRSKNNDTHWLNALIGRIFLAIHNTDIAEQFFINKIERKISAIKTPTFLTEIALKKINLGNSIPYFTNPQLKLLSSDGDLKVDVDVSYQGSFCVDLTTTVILQFGTRFRQREVTLGISVVVRKLEGTLRLQIKPGPSNRAWYGFKKMPNLEMTIEPIVSQRQITYGVVLRAIENRIRETIRDSIVLPHMEDIAFFNTEKHFYRGGIWQRQKNASQKVSTSKEDEATEHAHLKVRQNHGDSSMSSASLSSASEIPSIQVEEVKEEAKSIHNLDLESGDVSLASDGSDIEQISSRRRASSLKSVQSAPAVVVSDPAYAESGKPAFKHSKTPSHGSAANIMASQLVQKSGKSLSAVAVTVESSKLKPDLNPLNPNLNPPETMEGATVPRVQQLSSTIKSLLVNKESRDQAIQASVSTAKDAVKRLGAAYKSKRIERDIVNRQQYLASVKSDRLSNAVRPQTHFALEIVDPATLPSMKTVVDDDLDSGPMPYMPTQSRNTSNEAGPHIHSNPLPPLTYGKVTMQIPGTMGIKSKSQAPKLPPRKPVPTKANSQIEFTSRAETQAASAQPEDATLISQSDSIELVASDQVSTPAIGIVAENTVQGVSPPDGCFRSADAVTTAGSLDKGSMLRVPADIPSGDHVESAGGTECASNAVETRDKRAVRDTNCP